MINTLSPPPVTGIISLRAVGLPSFEASGRKGSPCGGPVKTAAVYFMLAMHSAAFGIAGCTQSRETSTDAPTSQLASVGASGASVSHDAGPVFLDPNDGTTWKVSHAFAFRNTSQTDTARLRVKTLTCGCAKCVVRDATLPPGSSTEIVLEYNLAYKRGKRREGAIVTTGLAARPQLSVQVSADVFPKLSVLPHGDLRASGLPGTTQSLKAQCVAYQSTEEPERRIMMVAEGDRLTLAAAERPEKVEKDGVRRIVLPFELNVSFPTVESRVYGSGQYRGTLRAQFGTAAVGKDIEWRVPNVIDVEPVQAFIQAEPAESAHAVVMLKAKEAFAISRASADDTRVEVKVANGAKYEQSVAIDMERPAAQERATRTLVTLRTNHPIQGVVHVPVFILWK